MSKISIIGFRGETPKVIPRLLNDLAAQIAFNTRLDDGGLTPVRQKAFEFDLPNAPVAGYNTIYKNGNTWMAWEGDVYAVPGPVAADRLYIMGSGAPKMLVGGVTYPLAVPFPSNAPFAALNGSPTTSVGATTRIYVVTHVTGFDEESEPSAASNEVFWSPGQTVTVSIPTPPAGRNINRQRIYRAQTSTTGTQFYFIAERAASGADFVDNVSPDSLQEQLPSANWNAPPDNLTGLISLPNGMMAAFRGKELFFSEPYRPHAWPEQYVLTMDYNIVALGAYSSSLIVATNGMPYMVTGTAPENMVSTKVEQLLPCINPRSMVDLGYSVVYASHDGLVQVSSSGAGVASLGMFSRDDWLRMNPYNMVGGNYNGRYFTTYNFTDQSGAEQSGSMIFDLTGEQAFLIRTDLQPRAMYYEIQTGNLYMLIKNTIWIWDSLTMPSAIQLWKSKRFILANPTNFGAILVEADEVRSDDEIALVRAQIATIMAANAALFARASINGEINGGAINGFALNGDMLTPIPTLQGQVSINVYADRKLVASVGAVNRVSRLPAGFKAAMWEVEVSSDIPITSIKMATTAAELKEF